MEGELNEYGVIKAAKQQKIEDAAGLDQKGDFDDYTIYDAGALNEYGVLKMERLVAGWCTDEAPRYRQLIQNNLKAKRI